MKKRGERDRAADLLEKILVFQLYALGVPQDKIARTVGRGKVWVNALLKGIPKGGQSDAGKEEAKKSRKRSGRR